MATPSVPCILLVDDDSLVRRLTRTILEQGNFVVIEASDGIEALNVFRQHDRKIDLLLTDIVMPRMTGTELVKQIKFEDSRLPVLFMSAYCDTMEESMRGIECVAKPFTSDGLVAKVRQVLALSA